MPATFVSTTLLYFPAPPVLEAGVYTPAVTNNGADFTSASAAVSVTFLGGSGVSGLSVDSIQIEPGATLSVTVTGTGLPPAGSASATPFYCVLIPETPPNAFSPVEILATLISNDGT